MTSYGIQLPQFQQIISGGENDLFSNGIVQIHIPSKIEISVFISNTCTHFYSPVSAKMELPMKYFYLTGQLRL